MLKKLRKVTQILTELLSVVSSFNIESWDTKVMEGQRKNYLSFEMSTHALLNVQTIEPSGVNIMWTLCGPCVWVVYGKRICS